MEKTENPFPQRNWVKGNVQEQMGEKFFPHRRVRHSRSCELRFLNTLDGCLSFILISLGRFDGGLASVYERGRPQRRERVEETGNR
jgi:hypothetical protein